MELYRSIRFKLFALISGLLGALVAVLTWYFPTMQIAGLEQTLVAKAETLSRMLVEQTRSSIAFADVETAREAFDSAAADADLAFVGIYRADGNVLYAQGQGGGTSVAVDRPKVERVVGRVRVSAPVVTPEGPRGTLVLELSLDRIHAQAHKVRTTGLLVGLLALGVGMLVAWWVGSSFGRRISAVTAHAGKVASGQLDVAPLSDSGRDEIGRMSTAFNVMVGAPGELNREVSSAAEIIDATTGMFLEMAREAEAKTTDAQAAEFVSSMVAGLSELALYSHKLREVAGRLKSDGAES
jgi:methyl-accepting chemotaxis protein